MAKRTGPSNPLMLDLIRDLKKKSIEEKVGIWKRVAYELERSTRSRRIINLSRINRFTNDKEVILVPGKVLGSGVLDHSVTVAAFAFSNSALVQLKQLNCDVLTIADLMQKNPKGKDVRIIG